MKRYKVRDYVYNAAIKSAVEVTLDRQDDLLFSCSLRDANRYENIYPRLSSGIEVFEMLDRRDRIESKFKVLIAKLRRLP